VPVLRQLADAVRRGAPRRAEYSCFYS
jgi:hypothetical protein